MPKNFRAARALCEKSSLNEQGKIAAFVALSVRILRPKMHELHTENEKERKKRRSHNAQPYPARYNAVRDNLEALRGIFRALRGHLEDLRSHEALYKGSKWPYVSARAPLER